MTHVAGPDGQPAGKFSLFDLLEDLARPAPRPAPPHMW